MSMKIVKLHASELQNAKPIVAFASTLLEHQRGLHSTGKPWPCQSGNVVIRVICSSYWAASLFNSSEILNSNLENTVAKVASIFI